MEELIDSSITHNHYGYTFKTSTVLIWIGILLLAVVFELLSWGGKSIIWLFSTGGLTAYCLSGMLILKGKNSINTTLFIATMTWTVYLFWGMLFNRGYPYNEKGITFFLIVVSIFLVIYESIKYYKKRKWKKNKP